MSDDDALEMLRSRFGRHLAADVLAGQTMNQLELIAWQRSRDDTASLINEANAGDEGATSALVIAAVSKLQTGLAIEGNLAAWLAQYLRESLPFKSTGNAPRDLQIGMAIHLLEVEHGYRPLRNT